MPASNIGDYLVFFAIYNVNVILAEQNQKFNGDTFTRLNDSLKKIIWRIILKNVRI